MTQYKPSPSTQRYRAHPVHTTLNQWREKLPAERPDNFKDLDPDPKNAYVRLRWVLRDLKARLDKLNPMLAQTKVLNNINQHLSQLQNPWIQYLSNPTGQWQQLDNHTEGLINLIRTLATSDGAQALEECLEELRTDMNAAIEEAQKAILDLQNTADGTEKKFQKTNEQLKGLAAEITSQKARLDQMLIQHNEAFTKAQQERATQFTNTEQERITKFGEAQEQRKSKFDAMVNEFEKTKKEVIKKHQAELASIESDGKKKSDELLTLINGQLDKAVEIVGTIVKTTMSGNYQIIANREYKNAWIMRGIAILAFLGMGGMVIWAVSSMNLGPNGINWSTFAFRISLGTAFLIPGIYCAKEASRHWNAEKHNRRIALELAALDPFLVKLDEAKQKEIIEKKADEYFGQGVSQDREDDLPALKNIYLRGDQLFKFVERIAKIVHGGGK
ncbi:hypothetical protein DBT_1837 [Dissulfuribacter thermophilus]|uniref:Uncharacterized protein n=1 Tax=Dissulfuribacter thermophilus TaxID=1156395 RepID=A0A1B9F498_9BACT|nr:hypothetical protein [Dissulfuribacter thermophilus]OCC14777.1 hypothetical protein DBT_1837 [Dissulfuribacter thermophilus]